MRHTYQERRGTWLADLLGVLLAVCTVACGVGEGTGRVTGTVTIVPKCKHPPGDPYDLHSDFFVGQPIDSDPMFAPTFPQNQMLIRIQDSGARPEDADGMTIWVFDSAKVARCIRGGSQQGVPEWDPLVCDRSPGVLGPNNEGRLYVGMTTEAVGGYLFLGASCPRVQIGANALGKCDDGSCPDLALCPGRGSWITFTHFGNFSSDVTKPIDADFRVNDGERIAANVDPTGQIPSFHLELCDIATVNAKLDGMFPIPTPRITATLEGFFDFKLERGQAGQPFP